MGVCGDTNSKPADKDQPELPHARRTCLGFLACSGYVPSVGLPRQNGAGKQRLTVQGGGGGAAGLAGSGQFWSVAGFYWVGRDFGLPNAHPTHTQPHAVNLKRQATATLDAYKRLDRHARVRRERLRVAENE